ncbi:hypothetical protein PTTG_05131 [Puccinia triticina 1-1 BBBD Race 1]|uniref:Uncharacterized protein n=1 Tax=Puccinia triticina (isolate 1-1 / race 1 (BBBD)) TaxID=630390 RepID=A0A180GDK2_PUCT1|nr:hypothetical protein PTTG_05131 [Puccinia triticina 1-1 BBBD Race 1]
MTGRTPTEPGQEPQPVPAQSQPKQQSRPEETRGGSKEKNKAPKKTIPASDRETRSSSKAPAEPTSTGGDRPTPMEGPSTKSSGSANEGTAVADRYRSLLGDKPKGYNPATSLIETDEVEMLTPPGQMETETRIKERMVQMIDRALAAEDAGDLDWAARFFNIAEGLGKPGTNPAKTTERQQPTKPPTPTTTSSQLLKVPTVNQADDRAWGPLPSIGPADTMPGGIIFNDAARPASHDLRSPLPLTIFNEVWQDKAIIHYAKKRSKADDSNTNQYRYTGYPYLCEYTQTYMEWSINHQGFHAALIRVCNYPKFAGWLLAHKRHCNQLVTQHGFMTGLRYDINIRMNAFAHRVIMPDGQISISNISVLNEEIAQKIIARTRKFEEINFPKSPYAKGGPRKTWDPVTGQDPTKAKNGSGNTNVKGNGGNHQSTSKNQNNQQGQSPPERGQGSGRQARSQGYKDNRWDGGYNDWGGDRGGN